MIGGGQRRPNQEKICEYCGEPLGLQVCVGLIDADGFFRNAIINSAANQHSPRPAEYWIGRHISDTHGVYVSPKKMHRAFKKALRSKKIIALRTEVKMADGSISSRHGFFSRHGEMVKFRSFLIGNEADTDD